MAHPVTLLYRPIIKSQPHRSTQPQAHQKLPARDDPGDDGTPPPCSSSPLPQIFPQSHLSKLSTPFKALWLLPFPPIMNNLMNIYLSFR
jgi:hypothetical protein